MGIQISGIASGFDTTSLIEELMSAERTKVDSTIQQKKIIELQKEAYNNINNKYSDFILKMRKEFGVDNSVSTSGLLRPSASSSLSWINKATSSSSSVSSTATSNAKPGSYDLTVHQLADTFKAASVSNVSINKEGTTVAESLGLSDDTMIDITLTNGKGESVTINQTAGSLSLSELADKMNSLDGVSVEYDSDLDRFFMKTTKTGEANSVTIQDNTNGGDGLLNALHLSSNGTALTSQEYKGQDAIVDFNGATGLKFENNNFSIQGIQVNLKNANPSEKITIVVDTDIDSIVDKMSTFVEEYNNLIEDIASTLGETKYKDYPPLTDAQKESMTDKQIELWEAKTNSGLIRNDAIIQRIQTSLREAFSTPIDLGNGKTVSLSDFGIETKGYFDGGKNGAIKIDEDKLRKALENNSEDFVQAMFGTSSDSSLNTSDKNLSPSQIEKKQKENGIFNRLTNTIIEGIGEVVNKAGLQDDGNKFRSLSSFTLTSFVKNGSVSILDKSIKEYNERITRLNTKLDQVESRYWKQFTAMETALAKMQTQQSSFSSFFS